MDSYGDEEIANCVNICVDFAFFRQEAQVEGVTSVLVTDVGDQ